MRNCFKFYFKSRCQNVKFKVNYYDGDFTLYSNSRLACNIYLKSTSSHVFSCEIVRIFLSTYFTEHLCTKYRFYLNKRFVQLRAQSFSAEYGSFSEEEIVRRFLWQDTPIVKLQVVGI